MISWFAGIFYLPRLFVYHVESENQDTKDQLTTMQTNLIRFINAFDEPHVGASTMYNSKRVYIKGAHLHGGEISNHNFFSGLITRNDSDWITVSTSDKNSILITQVINAKGKNIIDKVREGDRFNTPYQKIDRAISNRVKYGAN